MTFTKLGQNLQRKQRDRFWLQSRVNTTIFQVMLIIWTCGSFCVDAPLVMSSETLDFRRRAQSALSQESPSKATRVSSFEFMGKTECKLINRHIESALNLATHCAYPARQESPDLPSAHCSKSCCCIRKNWSLQLTVLT